MLKWILTASATTILLMNGSAASATNVSIEGIVRDAQTGEPLPGANVVLTGTSLGASSDIHGKYAIRNVSTGSYTIRATYVGYTSFSATLLIEGTTNITYDFKLIAVSIEGQPVIVTAQALGQNQAINQQLASSQIVNVVSSARIQELPDANAAESVGRLPGVSVTRQGGEGNQVVIRGLSPKYNEVMIDGVPMAPTDAGNRGTDLSMISSNMLEGIEVTKAITPDMDAEVLGGTVNFRLKEARESETGIPQIGLLTQGAYNDLEKTYSDYKVVGSIENRFLENQLGVFAEFNAERKNLTSNELGGSYYLNGPRLDVHNTAYLSNLNLNDILRDRRRYGGTLVMDYRIPDGKISLINFLSSGNTKTQNRGESYSLTANEHDYTTKVSENKLNVITNLLEFEQTLPLFTVDAKVSHSYSENHDPNGISFTFQDQTVGLSSQDYQRLDPRLIPGLTQIDLNNTYLFTISSSSSFSRDRAISGWLDILSPVRVSDDITGSVKFGGKIQYRERSYDNEGSDGVLTYSGGGLRQAILDAFPWMKQVVPSGNAKLPITLFQDGAFSYGKFLGGDYTMGAPTNIALMQPVIDIARKYGALEAWAHNSLASVTNDYSGFEHQDAVFGMVTANIGPEITVIAGARYQVLSTSYTAPRGLETSTSRYLYNYRDTTIGQSQDRWLPMAHLIYRPFPWLQIRLAYTNTLAYPDYNAITPRIDRGLSSVVWNNYALKQSHSTNYDVVVSVLDNGIGLFSIDGFNKRIDNLIFPVSRYVLDPAQYPGPPASPVGVPVSTYFNDPFVVDLLGIELDWQTHFWYLPGPLSGLVLSANYTHIFSRAKYPMTTVNTTYSQDSPYVFVSYNETFYENRLINQPDDIVNVAVGYDYSGFSTRISMFSQADVFKGESFWPELRTDTGKYLRWDISVKQKLPWFGLQVFFDLNNLNNAREIDINQGSGFPTAEQHYGLTADLGLRLKL
jgi:TonB-dependent receptor